MMLLHAKFSSITIETSSVAAGFGRHGIPPPACNPDLWPFDLETGVRVACKVENLSCKFRHARPLGSRIIRYVRDGRTDRRTNGQKQRLLPLPYGCGHNKWSEYVPVCTDRKQNDTGTDKLNYSILMPYMIYRQFYHNLVHFDHCD